MCGQFFIDEKDALTLQKRSHTEAFQGLIRPTDTAFVWIYQNQNIQGVPMKFGWARHHLIINARSETVLEKPLFQHAVKNGRCIIPCSYYHEWNKAKEKVDFYQHDSMLYMAGLYENGQFIILTTQANPSVRAVHDRMPLILSSKACKEWLMDPTKIQKILQTPSPLLESKQRQKQLSFF